MGGRNTNEGRNTKFYSLKAKADEVNIPHFVLSEKVAGTWVQSNKFDTMVGCLSGAEIKEKEYKGAKQNIFVLTLTDAEELSRIELTHNGTTYSILNALSSLQSSLPELQIKVYRNEAKNEHGSGIGKFYGNASILADNEKLSWGFAPASAPKKVPVEVNGKPYLKDGKQVYDDSDLRQFYEQVFIDKIMPLVSKSVARVNEINNPMNIDQSKPPVQEDENDPNPLPF